MNPEPRTARDQHFMRIALALAERGRGRTSPNPMVGALVVDDRGIIVGRGFHQVAGGPHAEVHALRDAGERTRGATLYCTLEPCSHTGRTGPCAPLVTAAGIRRAVIALEDPNPLVQGRGFAHLRAHGVEVTTAVLAAEAAAQNEVFLTNVTARRPFTIVKAAVSLDGCVAARPGVRTLLTGPEANRIVHRQRAEVDALAVGVNTILADDPELTARGAYRGRPLTRVVFDRHLRTPPAARIFGTAANGPIMLISSTDVLDAAGRARALELEAVGARVVVLEGAIPDALRWLFAEGVTSLLVEGGPTLHRTLLDAGVVDRVQAYITPRRLDPEGLKWLPPGRFTLPELHGRRAAWFGRDVLVEGHVYRNH